MIALIENGGFDCSMYNVKRDNRESITSYEHRLSIAKQELHTDILFFNQILHTICGSPYREELEIRMKLLFSKRLRRLLHGQERVFSYYFENGGMCVYQNKNEKRIIYVQLTSK